MTLQDAFIAPEALHRFFRYDQDTGKLFWRARTPTDFTPKGTQSAERQCRWFNTRYAGQEALCGVTRFGYLRGSFGGVPLLAHRVVWALAYGKWPSRDLDHINGNTGDNRLANLRCVSVAENARNRKRSTANSSGVVGVRWSARERKWLAVIGSRKSRVHLGGFANFKDAVAARKAAELAHGYHPNHGRAG